MFKAPVINYQFSIEEALLKFGFRIDDKDSGASVAYGFVYNSYGEIFVEFNQSFITNFQTDMKVFYCDKNTHEQVNLYMGVMPTNNRDFIMLMQMLLPSEEFKDHLGIMA